MLDSNGQGPHDNILTALSWLLQQSLDGVEPNEGNVTNAEALGVDVVSMSLGYPEAPTATFSKQVCAVMQTLRDLGIVFVAATGER